MTSDDLKKKIDRLIAIEEELLYVDIMIEQLDREERAARVRLASRVIKLTLLSAIGTITFAFAFVAGNAIIQVASK